MSKVQYRQVMWPCLISSFTLMCGGISSVISILYKSSINKKLILRNLRFRNNIAKYFVHFCSTNENTSKRSQSRMNESVLLNESFRWRTEWSTQNDDHLFCFQNESVILNESLEWRIEWCTRMIACLVSEWIIAFKWIVWLRIE